MDAQDLDRPIHRISVEQFHRMIEAGVFEDGDRVELIDGEMRDMTPIGPPRGGCTVALNQILGHALNGRALLSVQGPLELDDGTEFYPDIAVLESREDFYQTANPTPADVLLLVEVSDSSLRFDLDRKLPIYARAGIRICWIVDVRQKTIHEYRDPDRFGRRYRLLNSVTDGVLSTKLAGVEVRVATADLFRV